MCDECKAWEDLLNEVYKKFEEGTLHLPWCNAGQNSPTGSDSCCCPVGKVIKLLRKDNGRLKGEVDKLMARDAIAEGIIGNLNSAVTEDLLADIEELKETIKDKDNIIEKLRDQVETFLLDLEEYY